MLEAPAPGAVIDPTPAYTHPPEEEAATGVHSRLQVAYGTALRPAALGQDQTSELLMSQRLAVQATA